MKRRSLFTAVMLSISLLPVFLSDAQQTNTYPTECRGLSARLTNGIVRADNSIELAFVLHNSTNMPIQLAALEGLGAYQWRFRVVDAKGTAYELQNAQSVFFASTPQRLAIAPSEDQIIRCPLDMSTPTHSITTAVFTDLQAQRTNRWVFPVVVTGTFTACKYPKIETTWEGCIATEPLVVAK